MLQVSWDGHSAAAEWGVHGDSYLSFPPKTMDTNLLSPPLPLQTYLQGLPCLSLSVITKQLHCARQRDCTGGSNKIQSFDFVKQRAHPAQLPAVTSVGAPRAGGSVSPSAWSGDLQQSHSCHSFPRCHRFPPNCAEGPQPQFCVGALIITEGGNHQHTKRLLN